MPDPKFAAGQTVRYFPTVFQDRASGGLFEVVRQMPLEKEGYQYMIRSAAGVERIATELQLEPT